MSDSPCAPHPLAGRLAAPSFVMAGTVTQNAGFLSGKVDEVGLCFFETQPCLDYGPDDLAPHLASLPLRWHVHLPLDLPWPHDACHSDDGAQVADIALQLLDKVKDLQPRLAVLHPPLGPDHCQKRLLAGFAARWQERCDLPLLLENIDGCDLVDLGEDFLHNTSLGICLDFGHMLGHGQQRLLDTGLPEQARLVHWHVPGAGDRHLPLTALDETQAGMARALLGRLPDDCTHMLEIFRWQGVADSLPVLARLAHDAAGGNDAEL